MATQVVPEDEIVEDNSKASSLKSTLINFFPPDKVTFSSQTIKLSFVDVNVDEDDINVDDSGDVDDNDDVDDDSVAFFASLNFSLNSNKKKKRRRFFGGRRKWKTIFIRNILESFFFPFVRYGRKKIDQKIRNEVKWRQGKR